MQIKRESISLKLLLATGLALPVASAQESATEEVYELSPFVVDASGDDGYRATATTAGSRLNTQLKDVAASVTVLTEAFLDDLGAIDLAEGLQMVAGAETWETTDQHTPSLGQGYIGSDFGDRNNDDGSVRVRGLGAASKATNFIETLGSADRYNVTRADFLRGPNSILFGLARPAGLVNSTLKRGLLNRDLTSVDFVVDNYGSARTTVDISRVLKEDVLAVRAVGSYSDMKYMFDTAFKRDKRLFVTATYKPFENTTITAYHEDVDDYSRQPNYRLPQDNVSGWLNLWNQAHQNVPADELEAHLAANFYWDAANQQASSSAPRSPDYTFINPDTGASFNPNLRWDLDGRDRGLAFFYSPGEWEAPLDRTVTWLGTTTSTGGQPPVAKRRFFQRSSDPFHDLTGYTELQATDQGIFPWKNHEISVLPGNFRDIQGNTQHIAIEQKITEKFHVSATFQREQHQVEQLFNPIAQQQQISIDVNTTLPDGRENPNFLRPFVYGRNFGRYSDTEMDNVLLQANYDLAFSEVSMALAG